MIFGCRLAADDSALGVLQVNVGVFVLWFLCLLRLVDLREHPSNHVGQASGFFRFLVRKRDLDLHPMPPPLLFLLPPMAADKEKTAAANMRQQSVFSAHQ